MQTKVLQPGSEVVQASSHADAAPAHTRDHGLLLIGLFKLGKSIFFMAIGAGALRFLHKDLGETILHLASKLHVDAEGKLVELLMSKVDLIDHHRLRQISMGTFAYSALALVEGVGLMMEKAWAEYLTLSLTISFLPWELFELWRDANWFRFGLLIINLLVLGYLVWLLKRKHRAKQD